MNRIADQLKPRARRKPALDLDQPEGPPSVPSVSDGGERDRRGRFGKGNQAARGNHGPFARKCAELKAALVGCVTPQDYREIAAKLISLAKHGNLRAVELLLLWTVGRPAEAADPDALGVPPGEALTHDERRGASKLRFGV
jgi:hypothetical protein